MAATVLSFLSLTPSQREDLIGSSRLFVGAGLELLDSDENLIEDISTDLIANNSSVSRNTLQTLHSSCRLRISRQLLWGSQRLRPFMLLSSDNVVWYRQDLGVFLSSTPRQELGEVPAVWEVFGFDKLDILNQPHGVGFSVAAGDPIIAAVEALIAGTGETKYIINQASAALTAPADKVFPLSTNVTTLFLIDELLSSIGYRTLATDRDGTFRSSPIVSPADLPITWTLDADSSSTSVSNLRSSISDYYGASNRVVGINDDIANDIPVDGAGIAELTNLYDGETSVAERGGRTITKIIRGTYQSQAALVAAVQAALDVEKRVGRFVELMSSPNPVHGHYDVIQYLDSAVPVNARYVLTDWSLPLDGQDMTLNMRAV